MRIHRIKMRYSTEKRLDNKSSEKLLNNTKSTTNAIKTASKSAIQKQQKQLVI